MDRMATKSGLPLHPVALGTLYFGTRISKEDSEGLLTLYTEKGGNQIDTARSYANWIPGGEGASEETIGKWLERQRPCMRENLFIGTKGGLRERGWNRWRCELKEAEIRKELSASLEALRTDYIDLYWLHRDNEEIPVREIMEMMNRLAEEGKIRYFGVSNWRVERIRQALEYTKAKGLKGISASQIQYGLGICTKEAWGDNTVVCMNQEEYEGYRQLKLPVYAYSAQSEGYFALLEQKGEDGLTDSARKKYDREENRKRWKHLHEIIRTPFYRDLPLELVSPEYIFRSPFPTVVIQGGSNRERLSRVMDYGAGGERIFSEEEWSWILQDGDFSGISAGKRSTERKSVK